MGLIGDSTISIGTIDIFYYLWIETSGFKIFLIKKKVKFETLNDRFMWDSVLSKHTVQT